MYEKFGQFIDGKWQKSEKNETYEVINPATEEIIGKASKAGRSDVEKALKSAEKGLKVWRNTATMAKILYNKKNSRQDKGKAKCSCKMVNFRSWKTFSRRV